MYLDESDFVQPMFIPLRLPPWLGTGLENQNETVCGNVVFRWLSPFHTWRDEYYRLNEEQLLKLNRNYSGMNLTLDGNDDDAPERLWSSLVGKMIIPVTSVRGPPGPRGMSTSMRAVGMTVHPPVFENEADAVTIFLEVPPNHSWVYSILLAGLDR